MILIPILILFSALNHANVIHRHGYILLSYTAILYISEPDGNEVLSLANRESVDFGLCLSLCVSMLLLRLVIADVLGILL